MTADENELLTRVGPGTPMGVLLRRYWAPALLAREIAEPDGAPVEVELLGESFVAFRDSDGKAGLLQKHCPHRRASLVFARNEERGLRCIYHGWKFDVSGQCVDMPTEPRDSDFRTKVRAQAYPTHEAAGIVWAYLGPPHKTPPFPDYEWTDLPPEQCHSWKLFQECSYAQAVERDIDPAHVPILHRPSPEVALSGHALAAMLTHFDRDETAPRIEVQPTRFGFRCAAVRRIDGATEQARVTCFVLPWYTFIAPGPGGHQVTGGFVPRDDETAWHFIVRYNTSGPIDTEEYAASRGLNEVDAAFHKDRNLGNRYLQDRQAMKSRSFSGIEGILIEDDAIAEIQGPVVDRTAECLGPTDAGVVAFRQLLLEGARAVQRGSDPPGLDPAMPVPKISGVNARIEPGSSWQEACPLDPALLP